MTHGAAFTNEHDLVVTVASRLTCDDEWIGAWIGEIADDFLVVPDPRPTLSHDLRIRSWVVRDDDLDLLALVCDAVAAAAAAGFFTGSIPATSVVGVATAAFRLARLVRAKGAVLDEARLRVLVILRAANGLTVDQLTRRLHATAPLNELPSDTAVENVLRSLQAVALRDGTVVPLADHDAGGRWYAAGV